MLEDMAWFFATLIIWLIGFGCGCGVMASQNGDYTCTSEQIINHKVVCIQYTRKEGVK